MSVEEDRDMFGVSQEGGEEDQEMDSEESLNLKLASTQEERRFSIYTQGDYQRDIDVNEGDITEKGNEDSGKESNDGGSGRLGSGDEDGEEEIRDLSDKESFSMFEEEKNDGDKKVEDLKTGKEKAVAEKEHDEWQEIIAKERTKEILQLKNKQLQNEVYDAKETLWNRVKRVEEKKRLLVEQQAKLYCQNQKLESEGMEEECRKVTTENLEIQIDEMKGKVTQLEVNATRLLKRKVSDDKEAVLKIKTMSKLYDVDKNMAVFYTGASIKTTQTKEVLDELELIKNLSLIGCEEGSMKKVATEIKNMKLNGGREEVGVVIVEWGDLAHAEDDDELKSEAGTLMTILKLVTNRGGSKFGKFMLILPPVNGPNEKALEKFSKEVVDLYKPDIKVVALMREGPTAGFRNTEEMSGYTLRRCLTEVSKWLCEGDGNVCGKCGLLEHDGNCPVVIESVAISLAE